MKREFKNIINLICFGLFENVLEKSLIIIIIVFLNEINIEMNKILDREENFITDTDTLVEDDESLSEGNESRILFVDEIYDEFSNKVDDIMNIVNQSRYEEKKIMIMAWVL